MFAFSQSVAYFYMPGDLAKTPVSPGTLIRLGGLVGEGSVVRGEGTTVQFAVTDGTDTVKVKYTGILPDLFREGQGVVTEGRFEPGDDPSSPPTPCLPSMTSAICLRKSPTG